MGRMAEMVGFGLSPMVESSSFRHGRGRSLLSEVHVAQQVLFGKVTLATLAGSRGKTWRGWPWREPPFPPLLFCGSFG